LVVVGEAEVGVAGQHLGDDRGQAGAADDHQVVAVEVDQAGWWDDLVVRLQAEAAGQLAEPLVGLEAFLGDDRAGLWLVRLKLATEGDGELAVAQEQAEPVVDFETKRPRADENGEPLYLVQLIAMTDGAAEIIGVKVAGMPSQAIRQGHPVKVHGLVAQPWTMADRSGVAFRAARIESAVPQAKAS
jgi:hypothetical protein